MEQRKARRREAMTEGPLTPVRAEVEAALRTPEAAPSGDLVLYLIRQCPLFQGLPPEGWAEAAACARAWSGPHGAVLFREGEPAVAFGVVYAGRVKLTQRARSGAEALVRVVGEGQAFAWPGLFADGVYLASAAALEPARALVWDRRGVDELFTRFPVLAHSARHVVSRRMRELQDRWRELADDRVPERLARTLLRVVQPDGRRFEDGVFPSVPLSRREIAQLTGTTLFTVSRLFGQWERAGVLTASRERVVVADPAALRRLLPDRRPRAPLSR